MNPYEAAKEAVEAERTIPDRSYCRLYDGDDSGPEHRRCWLLPGHQCDCMTEREARAVAAMTSDPTDDSKGVVVIACDDGRTGRIALMREIAGAIDHCPQPVLFVVDAGDVPHILPEAEAREWAADGHSIRKLPPKKPGEYLPDHVWNIPVMAAKATSDVSYPAPNAGKQAPPPRREWYLNHPAGARGNVPPRRRTGPTAGRVKALPAKKAARNRQDKARKANRRKK